MTSNGPSGESHQHRRQLPLVVEGDAPQAPVCGGSARKTGELFAPRARPERLVKSVAADRSTGPGDRLVADKAKKERCVQRLPVRREAAVKGDRTFGQCAGLVGEEDLDVAEVFDGDEPLHQDSPAGERARAA